MAGTGQTTKPSFRFAETWGACSRCNARVRYTSLRRERLTGLLVCTQASGRGTRPCWDPWPAVYDFQAYPDKSLEPPPEPLPLRYNLDNIWGTGPAAGTTEDFANAPKPAPSDASRVAALVKSVPYYAGIGKSAAFAAPNPPLPYSIAEVTTIVPAAWDGTFLPSGSVRTVTPPNAAAELAAVGVDPDTGLKLWPWQGIVDGGSAILADVQTPIAVDDSGDLSY